MTTKLVRVRDLKQGDRVDLEGDPYADPQSDKPGLQCEYQVVDCIEVETPACTCVYFEDFTCAFPSDHQVKVFVGEVAPV